jgi:hypothetical protein
MTVKWEDKALYPPYMEARNTTLPEERLFMENYSKMGG